jgi:hypothetical protein
MSRTRIGDSSFEISDSKTYIPILFILSTPVNFSSVMTRPTKLKVVVLVLALLGGAGGAARAQEAPDAPRPKPAGGELTRVLDRAGEAVARYHAELFRIAYTETLTLYELRKDMTPAKSKEYVFDTIVEREALSEDEGDYYPRAARRLRTAAGKADAKLAKRVEAVEAVSVASLHFLTPKYREFYEFTLEGEGEVDGRRARRIRVMRLGQGGPKVEWRKRLVGMHFHAFAPSVITVWVDAENYDTLRVESRLVAPFEFESPRAFGAGPLGRFGPSRRMRYARHDYAVRFRRERFEDPEQTLLVPVEAEWVRVIEGASKPRQRTTIRFSDYRRYRSDVKVVEDAEPER